MIPRIGLFLATNMLVILTAGFILNVVLPLFGVEIRGGMMLAIFTGVMGMGGAFISLLMSKSAAKRSYRLQMLPPSDPLYAMVSRLASESGIPDPEVGIYDAPEANAFATGATKKSSLVAFSTGILNSLSEDEVEAVAAHEVSHIANGDMVTMTLLTGIANALVMFLARVVAIVIDQMLRGKSGRGRGLGYMGQALIANFLNWALMMLAYIPISAFSRWREYRADAGAARLTNAHSMMDALRKISGVSVDDRENPSYAMQKISSFRRVSLWSTHPPIEARIKALQQL